MVKKKKRKRNYHCPGTETVPAEHCNDQTGHCGAGLRGKDKVNVKDPGVGRASRNLIGNEPGQWNLLESRKGVAVVPEGRGCKATGMDLAISMAGVITLKARK